MKLQKLVAGALVSAMTLALAACGASAPGTSTSSTTSAADVSSTGDASSTASGASSAATDANIDKSVKIAMITDTGGINDQSFNQSAWEGLEQLTKDTGIKTRYIESKQASDFVNNFDTLIDDGNTLCWGIGYACYDAIKQSAQDNPDIHFAIVDNANQDKVENLTGVMFRAQESSFMVGYIAAATTKTNKVGFVGGQTSAIIDQFEWGYKAGVAYANKKLNKNVTVSSQYAESFSDAAKGKSIANKMYTDGCDIVYHAAGGSGQGVIEAAKDAGKFAIGVDRDQNYLAPENVLTSALKNVNVAVEDLSKKFASGEKLAEDVNYGLKENAVGISKDHHLYSDEVYQAALDIGDQIKDGKITPPANEKEFKAYQESL